MMKELWFIRANQELEYYETDYFSLGASLPHGKYPTHVVDRVHFHEHLLALVLVGI